jgi:tRNA threonylcarbamoyladenosine biosynthesis protein TsaB
LEILFVDSTYDISLGLLNEDLEWLEFSTFKDQKASSIIQKETYELLERLKFNIKDLSRIVTVAGPGFYTGLRLSEGFADVLKFSGIQHQSFFSYTLPKMMKVKSGVWMTKAYRGEYFFHIWNESESKNELISTKELPNYLANLNQESIFVHSLSALDDFSRGFLNKYHTTSDVLRLQPQNVFEFILKNNLKEESYYFRAPEDEFKVSL